MPNKIETDRIQEAYENMYDTELLDFAKNEGSKISADAFDILKKELIKRDIGADILKEIEHEIILQASLNHKRLGDDINRNLFIEAIEFSLTQKHKGTSDYDIYAGLIEMGVSEPYANYMVNKLSDWTKNLHEDSKTELQAGVAFLILGIIAMYIATSIDRFEFGAALLILIGIGRIIISIRRKKAYEKILDSIRAEESRFLN